MSHSQRPSTTLSSQETSKYQFNHEQKKVSILTSKKHKIYIRELVRYKLFNINIHTMIQGLLLISLSLIPFIGTLVILGMLKEKLNIDKKINSVSYANKKQNLDNKENAKIAILILISLVPILNIIIALYMIIDNGLKVNKALSLYVEEYCEPVEMPSEMNHIAKQIVEYLHYKYIAIPSNNREENKRNYDKALKAIFSMTDNTDKHHPITKEFLDEENQYDPLDYTAISGVLDEMIEESKQTSFSKIQKLTQGINQHTKDQFIKYLSENKKQKIIENKIFPESLKSILRDLENNTNTLEGNIKKSIIKDIEQFININTIQYRDNTNLARGINEFKEIYACSLCKFLDALQEKGEIDDNEKDSIINKVFTNANEVAKEEAIKEKESTNHNIFDTHSKNDDNTYSVSNNNLPVADNTPRSMNDNDNGCYR